MDVGFARLNICAMSGRCLETGNTFSRNFGIYPCFHKAFAFINQNSGKTYEIDYTLCIRKSSDGYSNNFAVSTKVQMCRLLNAFKQVIPFKFKFVEVPDKPDYIGVKLHLVGTCLQHKGLLMLSRTLFEYPHNMCGLDILRMRDMKSYDNIDFTKIPLIDLYLISLASTNFSLDESFINNNRPKLEPLDFIRKKLKNKRLKVISNVIKPVENRYYVRRIIRAYTIENIYSQEQFIERVKVYIYNYKTNKAV